MRAFLGWRGCFCRCRPLPLRLTCCPHPREAGPWPRVENCSLPAVFCLQRRKNRSACVIKVPWGRRSGAHDGARVTSHCQLLSPGHRPRLLGLHLPESWRQRQEDEPQGLRYLLDSVNEKPKEPSSAEELKEHRGRAGVRRAGLLVGSPRATGCANVLSPGPGRARPGDTAEGAVAASATPELTALPITAVDAPSARAGAGVPKAKSPGCYRLGRTFRK